MTNVEPEVRGRVLFERKRVRSRENGVNRRMTIVAVGFSIRMLIEDPIIVAIPMTNCDTVICMPVETISISAVIVSNVFPTG